MQTLPINWNISLNSFYTTLDKIPAFWHFYKLKTWIPDFSNSHGGKLNVHSLFHFGCSPGFFFTFWRQTGIKSQECLKKQVIPPKSLKQRTRVYCLQYIEMGQLTLHMKVIITLAFVWYTMALVQWQFWRVKFIDRDCFCGVVYHSCLSWFKILAGGTLLH